MRNESTYKLNLFEFIVRDCIMPTLYISDVIYCSLELWCTKFCQAMSYSGACDFVLSAFMGWALVIASKVNKKFFLKNSN